MSTHTELSERLERDTSLSKRESQVVAHRVDGATFHEMADTLDMSPQSAHKYYERAKEKYEQAERTVVVLEKIGFLDE